MARAREEAKFWSAFFCPIYMDPLFLKCGLLRSTDYLFWELLI